MFTLKRTLTLSRVHGYGENVPFLGMDSSLPFGGSYKESLE